MDEELLESGAATKGPEDYLRILKRSRWYLIVPAFTIWALVWGATWFLPKAYRSETMILVEPQKVPEQYVVSNVDDIQQRLQSISQQIVSRTRLLQILNEFQLYPETRKYGTEDELIARMRKDIEVELVQVPGNRDNVAAFKVYYTANSPQLAQQVTERLTQQFIEENVKVRQQQSANTTEFLESQLEESRKTLSAQEDRVREFKRAYMGQLPAQLQPNLQIMQGLQARLEAEMQSLNRAKQQNLYLESLLGQYRTIRSNLQKGDTSPETPAQLERDLIRMRGELSELTGRYTEVHPDVRKLKQQIAATERMKKQVEAQIVSSKGKETETQATSVADLDAASPMIQVESQLKANRLEIDQRQREVQRISAEIGSYQGRVNQIPVREQQLSDITRDYEQTRKDYESLLAKKNQSEMATNLVQRQQNEQFRVVDPPSLPSKPFSPNRLKLSLMALFAGCAFGVGLSLLMELKADLVDSENEVKKLLSTNIIATIPKVSTASEQEDHKRRFQLECAGAACIAMVLLAGFAITYLKG